MFLWSWSGFSCCLGWYKGCTLFLRHLLCRLRGKNTAPTLRLLVYPRFEPFSAFVSFLENWSTSYLCLLPARRYVYFFSKRSCAAFFSCCTSLLLLLLCHLFSHLLKFDALFWLLCGMRRLFRLKLLESFKLLCVFVQFNISIFRYEMRSIIVDLKNFSTAMSSSILLHLSDWVWMLMHLQYA